MRRIHGPVPEDPNQPAFFHAMDHAIGNEVMFEDKQDLAKYEEILHYAARETGVEIWATAANYNHHHQGVWATLIMLSKFMHLLQFLFADYLNRRRGRVGRFYFRSFTAFVKASVEAIKRCLAYINVNRFKDRAARSFFDGEMTSHLSYLGLIEPPEYLKVNSGLSIFNRNPVVAREQYAVMAARVSDALERTGPLEQAIRAFRRRKKGQYMTLERLRFLTFTVEEYRASLASLGLNVEVDWRVLAAYALNVGEGVSARSSALLLDCDRHLIHQGFEQLEGLFERHPELRNRLLKI